MEGFWKSAVKETGGAAILGTVFCLLAEALFAVFVQAFAPADWLIVSVNMAIAGLSIFVCCMILIRRERALFKGLAAGILCSLLTMLLFAAVAGGFYLSLMYLINLAVSILCGGAGAILGANLRKV